MTRPTLSTSAAFSTQSADGEEMTDDLRALKALRILLESRLINPTEYARRLESFQRRLEKGAEKK
jgi:hypothetical protein